MALATDKRKQSVKDEKPRYIRAGASKDQPRGNDVRRSNTRFTDIWNERR
jgi:hypothetical protein